MRILTFTSLFPNQQQPNSAVFIKNRMVAVNKLDNVDVRVVAPVPWFPKSIPGEGRWQQLANVPEQEVIDGLQINHPRYLVTPKVGMTLYGYSMFWGSLKTIKEIYQEWPFDLIDAHYIYPDGLAAVMLGKHFNVPVVVSARGTDMNLYPQFRLVRPLVKKVMQKSTGLISVCQSLADLMVDHSADPEKITVIPNGVDLDNFRPMEQLTARDELGLNCGEKILLSVGGLIERKGHHLLIDAVKILHQQQKLNFRTFIVGQGSEYKNLQQQIDDAGLSDQITLVGEVDNKKLGYWYSAADLFFLGSSREGWPNVVSEALACGTPVIATAVNGIPEIITSDDYGSVVERNPQSFAAGIDEAFQKTWAHDLIATYGSQRTWDVVADEVVTTFEQTLKTFNANKKILYHHRTQGQGAEGSHIRGMVDGFRQLGYQVDIVGPPGVDPYAVADEKTDKKTDNGKSTLLKRVLSRFAASAPQIVFELVEVFYNAYAFVKLYRQSKQHHYNFIYERYALNAMAGSWVSKLTGLPLVLEVNDATVIERSRPLVLKNIAVRHERIIFSRAKQIITITNHFKQLILDQYEMPKDKVLVLPNAIDPAKFDLSNKTRLTRAEAGIPEKSIVLGCVGAFVPWHGLEFLVDSLGDVAKDKNLYFLFIGDGPVKDDVLSSAEHHQIKNRVKFTGFLKTEKVPFYLDLVDICVIPGSNAHCSPMKLFEYMAMKKPVVLPKYQPLLDTVSHGKEGLFFTPESSAELSLSVLRLVDSKVMRAKLGKNGFKTVINHHTWQLNCERLIDEWK